MTNLGFNPENAIHVIDPIMVLLVQANTPLTIEDTRNTLHTLEFIEAFDIARAIVLDHVTPEVVELRNGFKPVTINSGKKYQKDKTFIRFWNDVHEEVTDALYSHFTRIVELSTGNKESTHPMIRRVMKLLIAALLIEFANHPPSTIFAILDKTNEGLDGKDIFGYMSRFMACGSVELHSSNIVVARKLLSKKCSKNMPKLNRILLIQSACEKKAAKKDDEDE